MTAPLRSTTPATAEPAGPTEWIRKALHVILTLAAAAILWWAPALTAQALLVAAALLAVTVEAGRRSGPGAEAAFLGIFGALMRPREAVSVTGATTLAVGLALTALLFPKGAALAGFLYVGLADAASAVVGRRWGNHRYGNGKSLEGSAAFFVTALLIGLALPGIGLVLAGASALALTAVEAVTLPVDDNLFLPVAGAAVIRVIEVAMM